MLRSSFWYKKPFNFHYNLIKVCKNFGYKNIDKGVCHGFSLKWLEACLLKDESIFLARMEGLVNHIKKNHKLEKISQEQRLELLSFLDGLNLYQTPTSYYSLFNKFHHQLNYKPISLIAGSEKILEKGGLEKFYQETLLITKQNFSRYLIKLRKILASSNNNPSNPPIGILLASINHTMALIYEKGESWRFMDINQYPPKKIRIKNTSLIIDKIIYNYNNFTNNHHFVINVTVISTSDDPRINQLKSRLTSWKNKHYFNSPITHNQKTNPKVDNLMMLAAVHGDMKVVETIWKKNVSFTCELTWDCLTFYAILFGRRDILTKIYKLNRLDFDLVDYNGNSLAFLAADRGYADIVAFLRSSNEIDINRANKFGITPAWIAAKNGDVAVFKEFLRLSYFNPYEDTIGCNLIAIAIIHKQTEIIKLLLQSKFNLSITFNISEENLRKFCSPTDRLENFIIQRNLVFREVNYHKMSYYQLAVLIGNEEIISLLDPSRSNYFNCMPRFK